MAVKECVICGNCKKLISGKATGKCPVCNKEFVGYEVGSPVMKELFVEGRSPTSDETYKLRNTPFSRKSLSAGERKKGIQSIIIGIVAPPLFILFGLWVINNFVGPGVLFFGYGALIAAPIFAILFIFTWGINVLVRDPRKKNIKNVFLWIWRESYKDALDNDLENDKEGHCKYAYGSVIRCAPDTVSDRVSEESLKEYLSKIRNTFKVILDEASEGINTSCKWKDGSNVRNIWNTSWKISEETINILNENETENGISKATGCFTVKKILSQVEGDDTYELHVAAVSVKVGGYYIKNGDYWFSYDLMPEIVK